MIAWSILSALDADNEFFKFRAIIGPTLFVSVFRK